MLRNLFTVAFAAIVTASSATAATVTIDFDNLPGGGTLPSGTLLTNQYASVGVTFSAIENGSASDSYAVQQFASFTPNPPNNSGNAWFNTLGFGNRADILRATFSSPVSNVQWYTDSEGVPPNPGIQFDAYDASNVLLETVFVGNTNFPNFQFTSFSVGNISRIDMIQPSDNWGWGLDNLQFDTATAPVPEPTSMALFGMTALGMGVMRRRRKQTAEEGA